MSIHQSSWRLNWGASWGGSWGYIPQVTDTDILQKPVNVVLAGLQTIRDRYGTYEIPPARFKTRRTAAATPTQRLAGDRPTFKTRTDSRGYD